MTELLDDWGLKLITSCSEERISAISTEEVGLQRSKEGAMFSVLSIRSAISRALSFKMMSSCLY